MAYPKQTLFPLLWGSFDRLLLPADATPSARLLTSSNLQVYYDVTLRCAPWHLHLSHLLPVISQLNGFRLAYYIHYKHLIAYTSANLTGSSLCCWDITRVGKSVGFRVLAVNNGKHQVTPQMWKNYGKPRLILKPLTNITYFMMGWCSIPQSLNSKTL